MGSRDDMSTRTPLFFNGKKSRKSIAIRMACGVFLVVLFVIGATSGDQETSEHVNLATVDIAPVIAVSSGIISSNQIPYNGSASIKYVQDSAPSSVSPLDNYIQHLNMNTEIDSETEDTSQCKKFRPPPLPRAPMVALTFDDGPAYYTDYILDVLEEHGARATFCVLGNRIEARPDTVKRIVSIGSEVIGHSWNHANLTRFCKYTIRWQILEPSAAIAEVVGTPPPPIFRAPYGMIDDRVVYMAEYLGYSILGWTVDPADWRHRDPVHIYNHIVNSVVDGSIVLLHDIRPTTAEAMRYVVPSLIEKGFQLVTASELIEYFYGELEPGKVYLGVR